MTTSSLPLPPGSTGLPLLGETLSWVRNSRDFVDSHRQYGLVYKTHLFGRPTVVLGGADAMRFVFTHDKDSFVVAWPKSTVTLLGPGSIAVQEGEGHHRRRKILQQVFGHQQIAASVPVMDRIAVTHIDRWAHQRDLTWSPLINEFTFHVACALVLGTERDIGALLASFQDLLAGLFSVPVAVPFSKYGRALRARKELQRRIAALVSERVQSGAQGEDALSVLLRATDERGDKLPHDEIVDQLITLLFAGYETSSSAIVSFCMLVGQHPEVLDKLRQEQRAIAPSGPITLEQVKEMTYLDQVIKEVMRLIPPVGGGFRKVVKPCEFNGYRIPAGWTLLYSVATTHQDARLFAAPDQFDPDRFAPDRAEAKQAKYSFVPFGGGPRVCIGMEYARLEIAVLGARLVRECAWQLEPDQDLYLGVQPTPRPRSGLKVRFWKKR